MKKPILNIHNLNQAIPRPLLELFIEHASALNDAFDGAIVIVQHTIGEGPGNAKTTAMVNGTATWRAQAATRLYHQFQLAYEDPDDPVTLLTFVALACLAYQAGGVELIPEGLHKQIRDIVSSMQPQARAYMERIMQE